MEVIKVENLSKEYISKRKTGFFKSEKVRKKALSSISFSVEKGEIIGFIGENGAGKSTTIKLLLGLIKKSEGNITVFGKEPFLYRQKNAQNIGVLFGQKSHLWWDLPLIDSFKYLQKVYGSVDDKWLEYLIKELNVKSFLNETVRELSLGQRMRGEFIASIVHKPELIFLDEPTIGLDIETKESMMNLILNLNKKYKSTVIFTTHEISDIEKVCERMILLSKGEVIYDGLVEKYKEIFTDFKKIILFGEKICDLNEEDIFLLRTNVNSKEYIFNAKKLNYIDILKKFPNDSIVNETSVRDLNLKEVLLMKDKMEEKI